MYRILLGPFCFRAVRSTRPSTAHFSQWMPAGGVEITEPAPEVRVIDMRSDTCTKPTYEMRAVLAAAEVGADAYNDDPTINGTGSFENSAGRVKIRNQTLHENIPLTYIVN